MKVFGNYAQYYDLLYRDKDYHAETQFIQKLIQTHAPAANSILDLGCGTGIHASLLAQKGYQVHGVDMSSEMLQTASDRMNLLPAEFANQLHFYQEDIRSLRLGQAFDVVLSLFHVVSYQITNQDLVATFQTAKEHLHRGGIFIFDAWYGPAVLSDRPTLRVKRLEDNHIFATRIAEPYMYPNSNRVDIKYQIFIRDKQNNTVDEIAETHQMRYLFQPEVELLLNNLRMQIVDCREWMSDHEPDFGTWGVYWIIRNTSV
jgi:SAM-dependent methyltransferase